MIVAIVDTTVLCELLRVPEKFDEQKHRELLDEFERRTEAKHRFIVPLTAIIETGNHIAHGSDGTRRRAAAERFVAFVRMAIAGRSPFTPTAAPSVEDVDRWLDGFPDDAGRKLSLGDRSIIAEWERERAIHPHGRVYIWSLDDDLASYDTGG